jgi:hypothetical protein
LITRASSIWLFYGNGEAIDRSKEHFFTRFQRRVRWARRVSSSELLALAFGLLRISACAFHFVLRDVAVTVLVELQK